MPRDKTLVVVLPTGEGKSLVFQALAASSPEDLVAVAVPTVTLALDHETATHVRLPSVAHRLAYLGGEAAANAEIRSRIEAGVQRLVFGAPEAMVASLRRSLLDTARAGRLAALVIDEAHLVHAWGTDFRGEFQMLAGLVAQLRRDAPVGREPRIVCLSATVTQMSFATLRDLFSPNGIPGLASAVRLRPEPDLWVDRSWPTRIVRQDRVLEALRHLPRPAILYVTLPDDADAWASRLRAAGYRRLEVVHGRTDTAQKDRVVKRWRTGELDLVVGTSAFGLGIDYPHVRTVIHACLPESLDRYYQEIGRSGRDNRASVALLLPAVEDQPVARSQSDAKLISVDKGLARWAAMFKLARRQEQARMRFAVDLAASPGYDPDMRSDRNEDWNAHVLNLMARGGLIRLAGLAASDGDGTKVLIDVVEDAHMDPLTWSDRIASIRAEVQRSNQRGYEAMRKLVEENSCPSALFAALYRIDGGDGVRDVVLACGGCSTHRRIPPGWFAHWPLAPRAPWPVGNCDHVRFNFLDHGVCFVARVADLDRPVDRRRLKQLFEALWRSGWRKCVIIGQLPEALRKLLESVPWCVATGVDARVLASNGLPPGPEIVWVDANASLEPEQLAGQPLAEERLFLVSRDLEDPVYPGHALCERRVMASVDMALHWIDQ
jgi:superfamily II DNA/RNA helicase